MAGKSRNADIAVLQEKVNNIKTNDLAHLSYDLGSLSNKVDRLHQMIEEIKISVATERIKLAFIFFLISFTGEVIVQYIVPKVFHMN